MLPSRPLTPECAGTGPVILGAAVRTAARPGPSSGRALADGVSAEALGVRPAGERVLVLVRTDQPSEWGEQPEPHGELVTVVDGRITEIIVFPTIHDAVGDAGGEPLSG